MNLLHKLCRTSRALISLSAALEAGNQFVGLAWIEQAHGSQRPCAAPGVPVDHEARRADRNVQCRRGLVVGHDGADRMFGFRPWDMVEQPRAGRFDRKIRRGGFGHRVEIDQPVLDRERHVIGAVAARDRDHLAGFPYPKTRAVGGVRGAARALDQLIAVAAAERGDLRADVGDL